MTPIQELESLFNNPNILWGDLSPQFRGYQLSNNGAVRSFKFYKKNPYGTLVVPKKLYPRIYSLSNENNQKVDVTLNELDEIVKKNGGYRIHTNQTIISRPRNPIMSSKSEYIERRDKINSEKNSLKEKVSLKLNLINE